MDNKSTQASLDTKLEAALIWRFQRTTLAPLQQWKADKLLGPDPMPELAIDDAHMEGATRAAQAWAESETEPATQIVALMSINWELASERLSRGTVLRALHGFRSWYLDWRPILSCFRRLIAVRKQIQSRSRR